MYRIRLVVGPSRTRPRPFLLVVRGRVLSPCSAAGGRIGYQRLERPVAVVERAVKGLLFDCRMCGRCVLSSTGMSCPMNCPKQLRNGPCGGVRETATAR